MTEHLRNDSPSEEQRAHDIKLAIEQIYYQVYMPRFNSAKGVPTIGIKYLGGCSEGALTKVMSLAVQDACSSTSPGKRGLKDFAFYLLSEKAVINGQELEESEIITANFLNNQFRFLG